MTTKQFTEEQIDKGLELLIPQKTLDALILAHMILKEPVMDEALPFLPYIWHPLMTSNHMILLNLGGAPIGTVDTAHLAALGLRYEPKGPVALRNALLPVTREMDHHPCATEADDLRRIFFTEAEHPQKGKAQRELLAALIVKNINALNDYVENARDRMRGRMVTTPKQTPHTPQE